MNEKERLTKIKNIQLKKEKMKLLKEKKAELNRLKSNELVQRFLKLSSELEDSKLFTMEEIQDHEFRFDPSKCSHDFWFSLGGRRVDHEGLDWRYYYAVEEKNIDCYIYCCLDCCKQIEIPFIKNGDFLKNHSVIQISKTMITMDDYRDCQKLYHKILLTNPVEIAYEKLLKKVK